MPFADTLLPEFDNEMRITRTLLERIPFNHTDTKPNPKSRTLIELASHIANVVRFGEMIVNADERDFAAPGPTIVTEYPDSTALLGAFDANVAASRAAIAAMDDSKLGDTWSLRNGANVIIAMPRAYQRNDVWNDSSLGQQVLQRFRHIHEKPQQRIRRTVLDDCALFPTSNSLRASSQQILELRLVRPTPLRSALICSGSRSPSSTRTMTDARFIIASISPGAK